MNNTENNAPGGEIRPLTEGEPKYKVLIADDETIIRWGLRSFVEQDPDFEVVAMADDGEMALNEARTWKPDLILADINMPFMNGLEFIEKLREEQPDVCIVIVTGYEEFEFVQKALRLGVKEYILKPIMEDKFFQMLSEVKKELSDQRRQKRYIVWAESQIERYNLYMTEKFFQEWLGGQLDLTEAETQIRYLKLDIPAEFTVADLDIREAVDKPADAAAWDLNVTLLACQNVLADLAEEHDRKLLCVRLSSDHLALISERLDDAAIHGMKEDIRSSFSRYLHLDTKFAFRDGAGLEALVSCMEECEKELSSRTGYSRITLEAIRILEESYADSSLSLNMVAEKLAVTPQHLSRTFRGETGVTFVSYLSKLRIRKAMLLLQDPNLKMYEIAEQTGYVTQHYFSNVFKKAIGVSPADYRKAFLTGEKE